MNIAGGGWKDWGKKAGDWMRGQVRGAVEAVGQRVVQRAKELAPVKTGFLRSQISYTVTGSGLSGLTLHIVSNAPYGIFQEFGTRNMRPHPHIRPAINEMGAWWASTTMDFASPTGAAPGGQWNGLRAVVNPRGGHFTRSPGRRLTASQERHVRQVLTPSLRAHQWGPARKARLRVGRTKP